MNPSKHIEIEIQNNTFILLPEKAIFWVDERGLIISDVHLGKAGHFRKHGIALPKSLNDENLHRINNLISIWNPGWILFLGDLFHSEKNIEWNSFKHWRQSHYSIRIILVMGNHELYPNADYNEMGIECMNVFNAGPFLFVHDNKHVPAENSHFVFSGHIHPSYTLKGKGRQRIKIPCFYLQNKQAILPAFGTLTGTFSVKSKKNTQIFGLIDHQILQIL